MNIGVIHDTKHLDRLGFISELAKQNINYYRIFPAIYEKPSHAGIMKAHKNAVKTLFETPDENGILPDRVCVMEDDIVFSAPDSWERFLRLTPPEFDIYTAGYYFNFGLQVLPFMPGLAKLHDFSGLHCYMIHRKALSRFLALPHGKHIDRACKGMDIYTCYPVVAMQAEGFSYRKNKVSDYSTIIAKTPFHR